jgi:hypothetical protein
MRKPIFKWIAAVLAIILIFVVTFLLIPPSIHIEASQGTLGVSVGFNETTPAVDYGQGKTDLEKFNAIYSLMEQMRIEHNRLGATVTKSDAGKWAIYTNLFREKYQPLAEEYANLKEKIRQANYPDKTWDKMSLDEKADANHLMYPDKASYVLLPTSATYEGLDQLKAVDFATLKGDYIDPTEDLTSVGWTASGSGHTITATKDLITSAQTRNQDLYLYKDYTANHFDALNIDFEIYYTSGDWNYAIWGGPGLSVSTVNDFKSFGTSDVQVAWREGASYLELHLYRGPGTADDYTNLSATTLYYCALVRVAGNNTITCYIYSDAAHNNLLYTNVTAGYGTATKWRYLYASNVYNDGASGNRRMTAYVQNIDLNEVAGEPSITESPASLDFGSLWQNQTYYAKGTSPHNPVQVSDCSFIITNPGSITENITTSMTNMTGGTAWSITSGAPGLNTFRITAYYVGQNPASGVVLSNSAQAFYNGLAASANISFDFKYETGTWVDGDTTQRSGVLQITAVAP